MIKPLSLKLRRLLKAPLEPVLQPSQSRLFAIALLILIGHPFFGWIWTVAEPQTYENMIARVAMSVSAVPLFWATAEKIRTQVAWRWYSLTLLHVAGPAFMVWMYLMNPGSAMWMATLCVTSVLIYQLVDWRLATFGVVLSIAAAWLLAQATGTPSESTTEEWLALGFSWIAGFLLGISAANEHLTRLRSTMSAIGVMAHELRTPLATLSLLAQAARDRPNGSVLGASMDALARNMNHQIDSQIVNAQLLNIPQGADLIGARAICQNAIDTYPFKRSCDRGHVTVIASDDFLFMGTTRLFNQVIQNLIKNALHSLMRSGSTLNQGDLRIHIDSRGPLGRIRVEDHGQGISAKDIDSVFEPFFSGNNQASSGLGLAFCKSVVEANGGYIQMTNNTLTRGVAITIGLPRATASIAERLRTQTAPLTG